MIRSSRCWFSFSTSGSMVSVRVPVWELTWIDAFGWQPVAVVLHGVWLIGSLLPVDHYVFQVNHPPRAVVMPVVLGVVGKVFVGHMDLMTKGLVIAQFVDGVAQAVGFNDQEERRVTTAEFQKPRLAKPSAGIDHGDVGQVVVVELAGCRDLHRCAPLG